jgi:DMSO/TMAO reductase YedYZ molybdopterin-dependent catalytic subunit
MAEQPKTPPLSGPEAEQAMRRLTRRGFMVGAVAAAAGLGAWRWLGAAAPEGNTPWPLRRMLRFNQKLAESVYSSHRLAPTFPAERVVDPPRTNGTFGLTKDVESTDWQINVKHAGREREDTIALKAIQALPRVELITELKCVEGWSEVMHFSGVRFADFLKHFSLGTRSGRPPDPAGDPQDLYPFVYLATPEEDYYVGLDMASAMHPQTLLCDAMNGEPLTRGHGSPLRLYLAVKYGYKSLKRIGRIRFQKEIPRDFWADRGYDWYAGL